MFSSSVIPRPSLAGGWFSWCWSKPVHLSSGDHKLVHTEIALFPGSFPVFVSILIPNLALSQDHCFMVCREIKNDWVRCGCVCGVVSFPCLFELFKLGVDSEHKTVINTSLPLPFTLAFPSLSLPHAPLSPPFPFLPSSSLLLPSLSPPSPLSHLPHPQFLGWYQYQAKDSTWGGGSLSCWYGSGDDYQAWFWGTEVYGRHDVKGKETVPGNNDVYIINAQLK